MSIDTSHKKYILLRHGNNFGEGKNTLKGFENKTYHRYKVRNCLL